LGKFIVNIIDRLSGSHYHGDNYKTSFGIYLVYVYGLVFLAITVSINLAKKMSDTHMDLEKQLVQVKELSQKTIEQERKVKRGRTFKKVTRGGQSKKNQRT
jgi:hypothetical protein